MKWTAMILFYENKIEFTEEISDSSKVLVCEHNKTVQINQDHRKCGTDQMTIVDIPLHSSTQWSGVASILIAICQLVRTKVWS